MNQIDIDQVRQNALLYHDRSTAAQICNLCDIIGRIAIKLESAEHEREQFRQDALQAGALALSSRLLMEKAQKEVEESEQTLTSIHDALRMDQDDDDFIKAIQVLQANQAGWFEQEQYELASHILVDQGAPDSLDGHSVTTLVEKLRWYLDNSKLDNRDRPGTA